MPAPKPRKGNRGQVHRDQVARKQAAQARKRDAERQPAPPRAKAAGAAGRTARAAGAAGRTAAPRRAAAPAPAKAAPAPGPKRGLGGEQVEGRRAVRELLLARKRRVKAVFLAEGVDESPLLAEIEGLCADNRVPVKRLPRTRIEAEARSEAPQGVIALAEPLPEADLEALLRRTRDRKPFLVCLDGITDPHNLGAILRTAECAGATGVVVPRHRAAHVTPTVAKAAAGAVEYLPIAVVPGLPAALQLLKDKGVWTVGLDEDGTTSLFGLEVATEPVALVLGAEGAGLSRLVRQRCDLVASIPQHGAIDSLNVSAAAALACFEVARHRSAD